MSEIIVGVDGSDGAAEALRWAVREGRARDWPVSALYAWSYLGEPDLEAAEDVDPGHNRRAADQAVAGMVAAAVGDDDARQVSRRTACEPAADALVDVSKHAGLLVLGARGEGGFKGLLVGSISRRCVQQAHCPVVVVRGPTNPATRGRIVVGVDGSPTARRALQWALDTARAHHATVDAVHAWAYPALAAVHGGQFDATPVQDAARARLETVVASTDRYDVPVEQTLACGGAARSILTAAADADLVVVGSRGRNTLQSIFLGSVSHQVLDHAPCPVAVIPPGDLT